MPSISSFNTPLSALRAQQRILEVSAHNIANASTPGYRRQTVQLRSVGSGEVSTVGQRLGVDVAGVVRSSDDLLVQRAAREEGARTAADTTKTVMASVEAVFPEPTDIGLASQLDDYWASWTALANDPANQTARAQVLAKADTVVSTLHRSAAALVEISDTAKSRLVGLATEVNSLTGQLAAFNQQVVSASSPELLDQRDQTLAQLTKLTGAVAQTATNGQLNVFIGGRQVVAGSFTEAVEAPSGTLRFTSDTQAVLMTSGEGSALAATVNDVIPRYSAALDGVASSLVASVNALHIAGYSPTGTTGLNFFDPLGVTAGSIAISVDVAGQPAKLATGAPVLPGPTAPGALNGDQARAMAALTNSTVGADASYQTMIGALGVESKSAQQRSDVQAIVADNATQESDSVGAVSLDEEMTQIMQAQRAYQASSKVLSTVDELLGFLIDRLGR